MNNIKVNHSTYGKPSNKWIYVNNKNESLFCICRWELPEGKKILQATLKNDEWVFKGYSGIRPVYNLIALQDISKPILIIEGEKTCDKASQLFPEYTCITSSGGTNAYEKTDWSILKDRSVVIFPDNDKVGFNYAKNVAKELYYKGVKEVCIVDIPEYFPEKWDVADNLPEGYDLKDIQEMVNNAKILSRSNLGILQAMSFNEIMNANIAERETLLEPLIKSKSISMVFAYRGVGKTFFSLGLACAIASGGKFLKWQTTKPYKVLYIDGEMQLAVIRERLTLLNNDNNLELLDENLSILASDTQEEGIPNILSEEGQRAIEPFVNKADLIIIDNIATLCPHPKQNDIESWLNMQSWALSLRRRNKSIIFVHHSGKSGEQRGTSAKEDIMDLSIELKQPMDYEGEGLHFELNFTKFRHLFGEDIESLDIKFENGKWEYSKLSNTRNDKIKELHELNLTNKEIATELNLSASTISRVLRGK
ncbi:AAA family ATPase [Pseudomonadota bacterium]